MCVVLATDNKPGFEPVPSDWEQMFAAVVVAGLSAVELVPVVALHIGFVNCNGRSACVFDSVAVPAVDSFEAADKVAVSVAERLCSYYRLQQYLLG